MTNTKPDEPLDWSHLRGNGELYLGAHRHEMVPSKPMVDPVVRRRGSLVVPDEVVEVDGRLKLRMNQAQARR